MTDYVNQAMRQNGCELVSKIEFPARGFNAAMAVVIAYRNDNPYHPFVVWKVNLQCGGAFSGGYYEHLRDAWADYDERVRREIKANGGEIAA